MPRGRIPKKVNDSYFSELNTENCQWAGYIASDGCIHKKQSIRLQCKTEDRVILETAKKDLGIENNIFDFLSQELSNGKKYPSSSIYFSSEKIVSDLLLHFNISKRKSFTLKAPNITDQKLKLSYLVGLINGDGAIYRESANDLLRFNVTGTMEICEWCRSVCNEILPLNKKYIYKNGSVFSFSIHNKSAFALLNILLEINCFHLSRKWSKINIKTFTKSGKSRIYV